MTKPTDRTAHDAAAQHAADAGAPTSGAVSGSRRSAAPSAVLSVSVLRGVEAALGPDGPVPSSKTIALTRADGAAGAPAPTLIEIPGQRLRALVALLALTPGVARRADYLADQLWDGRPPSANALQALVSRLRRLLGAEVVVTRPTGYALAIEPELVDVVRFDRLAKQGTAAAARRALALAGPEPLAEFPDVPDLADEARRIEAECWRLRDLAESEPEPPMTAPSAQSGPAAATAPPPAPRSDPAPRPLIGRDALLAEIGRRLTETRLLTLVGAGGAGKTSLARHLAYQAGQSAFVELAPVTAPDVPAEALVAVGGRDMVLGDWIRTGGESPDPRERLAASIGSRPLLLVLDNCEHVVSAAADLAAYLLDRCAAVTILATSREPLAVPGELRLPVDPLMVPPIGSAAEDLARFSAMELLVERGRAVRPTIGTGTGPGAAPGTGLDNGSGDEARALAEICRRLDGIPLALELAAARFNSLSPRQVADRLDDRFNLLTNGARTVLPRQQTLRAVVDWSWDLLDRDERELLMVSAVFLDGATIEDLESVVRGEVLDRLDRLVAKSLVVARDQAGQMRYRLLETIREYALERLAESGLADLARRRHAECYAHLVKTADPLLRGPDQLRWIARLDAEQDNIRVALATAVEQRLVDTALAIAGNIGWYAQLRGQWELRDSLARVVELVDGTPEARPEPSTDLGRAYLFRALSSLDYGMSPEEAGIWLDRARQVYAEVGGYHTVAVALDCVLAMLDAEAFPVALAAADAKCLAAGDEWGLALVRMIWGRVSSDEDVDRAEQLSKDGFELFRRCGDRWGIAACGEALGLIESLKGNHRGAIEVFLESLRHGRALGAVEDQTRLLAQIAYEYEYLEETARSDEYLGEAESFISSLEYSVPPVTNFLQILQAGIYLRRGDLPAVRAALAKNREQLAAGHSFGFKVHFDNLSGALAVASGEYAQALGWYDQALNGNSRIVFDRGELAEVIEGIAEVADCCGHRPLSARLLGAAFAVRPVPLPPTRARAALALTARLREALPDQEFEAEYAAGRDVTPLAAFTLAGEAIGMLRSAVAPGPGL